MSLPPCHSRIDLRDDHYFCAHPKVHAPRNVVTAKVCAICSYCLLPPPDNSRPFDPLCLDRDGPCRFLGGETGRRECPTCRGHVVVKVFACSHPQHVETTLHECENCLDYKSRRATPAAQSR